MSLIRKINKINLKYVITAIIVIVVGSLCISYIRSKPQFEKTISAKAESTKIVLIGKASIQAELATTQEQWIQGLSDRTALAPSMGMLFVFDHSDKWGIWMKDMNFSIDVIWITDDNKINYIVEDMTPESYPKTYEPQTASKYVLEVPSGTVKNFDIKEGQFVVIK